MYTKVPSIICLICFRTTAIDVDKDEDISTCPKCGSVQTYYRTVLKFELHGKEYITIKELPPKLAKEFGRISDAPVVVSTELILHYCYVSGTFISRGEEFDHYSDALRNLTENIIYD